MPTLATKSRAHTSLADLSLVEAADAVRGGQVTSQELLAACRANWARANGQVNATIWLDWEGAELAAAAADAAERTGQNLG